MGLWGDGIVGDGSKVCQKKMLRELKDTKKSGNWIKDSIRGFDKGRGKKLRAVGVG